MFLEKDATWHDYIELLEFGMQFQQTSKFEAVAKSCVSKDSGCTSCSRLRAGKHWYCPQHQVSQLTSSGNGLKTENLNIFDVTTCQNLSKLFRQLIAAVDQVHVCPVCAELPPEMPTLGLAATYLVDVFPPLARSASTSKLCKWTFVPRWTPTWSVFPWLMLRSDQSWESKFLRYLPKLGTRVGRSLALTTVVSESAWRLTLKHHIFCIFNFSIFLAFAFKAVSLVFLAWHLARYGLQQDMSQRWKAPLQHCGRVGRCIQWPLGFQGFPLFPPDQGCWGIARWHQV